MDFLIDLCGAAVSARVVGFGLTRWMTSDTYKGRATVAPGGWRRVINPIHIPVNKDAPMEGPKCSVGSSCYKPSHEQIYVRSRHSGFSTFPIQRTAHWACPDCIEEKISTIRSAFFACSDLEAGIKIMEGELRDLFFPPTDEQNKLFEGQVEAYQKARLTRELMAPEFKKEKEKPKQAEILQSAGRQYGSKFNDDRCITCGVVKGRPHRENCDVLTVRPTYTQKQINMGMACVPTSEFDRKCGTCLGAGAVSNPSSVVGMSSCAPCLGRGYVASKPTGGGSIPPPTSMKAVEQQIVDHNKKILDLKLKVAEVEQSVIMDMMVPKLLIEMGGKV